MAEVVKLTVVIGFMQAVTSPFDIIIRPALGSFMKSCYSSVNAFSIVSYHVYT